MTAHRQPRRSHLLFRMMRAKRRAKTVFNEPLAVYFADFGQAIQLDNKVVTGIFDREFLADMGFGQVVSNADPVVVLPSRDVPEEWEDITVTVAGVAYAIDRPEPDGTGVTVLQLRKK